MMESISHLHMQQVASRLAPVAVLSRKRCCTIAYDTHKEVMSGQVEWLRARISAIPVRLVFESALELMGTTQIGTFQASPSCRCMATCLLMCQVQANLGHRHCKAKATS